MNRRLAVVAAGLAAALALPAAAQAQGPFSFGVAVGPTFPTGTLGDSQEWGYNVTGSLGIKPMLSPVGIRGEVMWNSLTGQDFPGGGSSSDTRVFAGTVNAELGLGGIGFRPYLIGGLGYYSVGSSADNSESESNLGINGGVGVSFGLAGFSTFAEARFHNIFVDSDVDGVNARFIPVTFGLRF